MLQRKLLLYFIWCCMKGIWIKCCLLYTSGNGVGSMVTRLVDHYVLERPQQKAQALAAKANAEEKDSE